MKSCATCTYYDGLNCTNPALLQDAAKLFRPPSPEFVSPLYMNKDTGLVDRLITALGIVRESGPSGETLALPDGSRFPASKFKPHEDVEQVAHIWHLARRRGIFIYYGPEQDKDSDRWEVEDRSTGIKRDATAQTAPRIILEMIVARLENDPAPAPTPEPVPGPTPEPTPEPTPPLAPTITSFTATPSAITAGEDVVLTWEVVDVDLLDLEGIGEVLGLPSVVVNPTTTTTYTLTATSIDGVVVTAQVTVTVEEAPVV